MARQVRKQGYAGRPSAALSPGNRALDRYVGGGGGSYNPGPGDRTRNTDTRFRRLGAMHNFRDNPRNKRVPRLNRGPDMPYFYSGAKRA